MHDYAHGWGKQEQKILFRVGSKMYLYLFERYRRYGKQRRELIFLGIDRDARATEQKASLSSWSASGGGKGEKEEKMEEEERGGGKRRGVFISRICVSRGRHKRRRRRLLGRVTAVSGGHIRTRRRYRKKTPDRSANNAGRSSFWVPRSELLSPKKTKSRRNISGREEKSEVPILGGKGGGEETQIGKLFSRAGPSSSSLQEKSFRATEDRP